jgi:uncharacterized membrane protein HdeD (DUF308 family)
MTTADAQMTAGTSKLWWVWLVTGILWILISLVILQFDNASVATVGVIVGILFMVAGVQYLATGSQVGGGWKWVWWVFGAILLVGGLIAIFYPTRTFLAIANILGFVFAFVGVMWIVEAFATKDSYRGWWFSLIAGIAMVGLGFWLGGQFLITKADTLLIFAGVWALMKGITEIVLSFHVKSIAD